MLRRVLLIAGVLLGFGSPAFAYPDYYDISNHDQAQQEARARNLPLAWVGGLPELLPTANPDAGSQADLAQMAMATLAGNAVIIYFNGRDMTPVPAIVHAQFHIQDDGPLEGGAAWVAPKIVFTNPEVTRILGRVSQTQMLASRQAPIYFALQAIRSDPTLMEVPPPAPPPPPAPKNGESDDDTSTADNGGVPEYNTRFGKLPLPPKLVALLNQNRDLLKPVGVGLVVLLLIMMWWRRSRG